MDYKALREAGIAHIQKLAGHFWTDHNAHDPGITMLEHVCFALTDLSYRSTFEIPDLLAEGNASPEWFSPGKVMTTAPVTINDLRKLLIDVPGVRNVWVFPVIDDYQPRIYYDDTDQSLGLESRGSDSETEILPIKGLYRIMVATKSDVDIDDRKNVVEAVRQRYQANRGLCEDLSSIDLIEDEMIQIKAEIEIGYVNDPESLLAGILHRIHEYISPSIRFYSLSERMNSGFAIEDLMSGPRLNQGFIDDHELDQFKLLKYLRASDLIRLIMESPKVLAVRRISMSESKNVRPLGDWTLEIPQGKAPAWNPFNRPSRRKSFVLLQDGLPIRIKWRRVQKLFNDLLSKENHPQSHGLTERDVLMPAGRNRNVSQYQSIQMEFPDVYGIGLPGLPENASDHRKIQAHQLKAYLSFFDQIMANYFAQLGHMNKLFSHQWPESGTPYSYAHNSLFDSIPQFEKLLVDTGDISDPEEFEISKEFFLYQMQELTEDPESLVNPVESQESALIRKNRFLNHMLARFAEQMTDYSLDLFAQTENGENEEDENESMFENMARAKSLFLKDYPELSSRRGCAFDYTQNSWETINISGLKHRVSRMMGMVELECIPLSELENEHSGGFHVIEHILFRPRGGEEEGDKRQKSPFLKLHIWENEEKPPQRDPYSLQMSFIFPGWLDRFQSAHAKQAVLKILREETPAHLRIYIRWLSKPQMKEFESSYKLWLKELQTMTGHGK